MILQEQDNPTLQVALNKNATESPSKTFIIHRTGTYTYAETASLSDGFAQFLLSSQVQAGDKVALMLPRIPELIISFLGAVKAKAIPAPTNYSLSPYEIEHFLKRIRPAVLVIHASFLTLIDPGLLRDLKVTTVVVGAESKEFVPWRNACPATGTPLEIKSDFEEIAYLNFTTGSSGLPKGAIATHANVYWNTKSAVEALDLTATDVHLCMFASFAHPHELFTRALYTGASLVLLEEINPKTISKTINTHGVTCMMGLAPMYDMMARHCGGINIDSLRFGESGGMFTRPDISKRFREKFGIPLLSVWGSTETTGIALANRPGDAREDGSMGKPCPYYTVKIINEDGHDAAVGEIGELVFRGKGVIQGYDEDIPVDLHDGWYHSGDMGRMDENGYFYFADRKNGLIKVAGLKVYPLQVENILLSHPHIQEAAVIGVNDPMRGMVPKAFIATKDNRKVTHDDINDFCKKRLAPYMIPKLFEFMGELPKIGSGKINKKALITQN